MPADLLKALHEQLNERIKKHKEGIDPGPRDPIPLEFVELPPAAGILSALCVECVECGTLVRKTSTEKHQDYHHRLADEIIATRFHDGPLQPPPW